MSLRRRRKEEEEKEEEGAGNQPIHEPCTTCIVGVARGTSAMTSDSGGVHSADSAAKWPSGARVSCQCPNILII